MIRFKTCNVCKKKFRGDSPGRIQIIKRKDKGKVEIWVCPGCVPEVKKRLKDLDLIF
jgi:hypothetical protein